MSTDAQVSITDGPSKFDLTVAFFDRFGPHGATRQKGQQRSASFATGRLTSSDPKRAGALAAVVRLDSLKHENGSGHAYLFTGELVGGTFFRDPSNPGVNRQVRGLYNTRTRKGFIEPA